MQHKILKLEEIDMKNIEFMKPIKKKSDIIVPIHYKTNSNILGKTPLLVQVPSLYLNDTYKEKSSLILPFMGKTDYSTNLVCEFFNNLDSIILSNIKKILYELVNEKNNKINFSDISYKAIVNEIEGDDNEIYKNGLIKYKLHNNKDFATKIFDENKNLIDVMDYSKKMVKGTYIKSIIEINSLVIRDSVIQVYIKPHQLRVQYKFDTVNLDSYSFIDSDDENDKAVEDNEIVLNTQTDYLEINRNSPTQTIKKEEQQINNLEKQFENLCNNDSFINEEINEQLCSSETDVNDITFNSEINNIENN
ncbi:hypothetical protein Catovirus_1_1059 [Catovirus CTV1]|uniref:Uncharacterized protein n=1 Tax=Catovirus CTV1 TaxID=1977631 RepID=A0A1V0SBD1_9VIRU|nr:hypothetical protein Catovirus_1_1059 [Catovirus CTV1]